MITSRWLAAQNMARLRQFDKKSIKNENFNKKT